MAGAAVGSAAGFNPTVDLNQMPVGRKVTVRSDDKQAFGDIISRIGTMASDNPMKMSEAADPVKELGTPADNGAKGRDAGNKKQSGTEVSAEKKADDVRKTGKEATATDGRKKTDTDVRNTDRADTKKPGQSDQQEGLSDEGLEDISEVISSGIQNIISQIAETLNITEDEINLAMEGLGLDEMSLFDPKAMSSLFLNLTGQDETALLVNGELADQLSLIQETAADSLESIAEVLEMPVDSLKEQLALQTGGEAGQEVTEEKDTSGAYSITTRIGGREVELSVSIDEAGQPVVTDTAFSPEKMGDGDQKKGSGRGNEEHHQTLQSMADSIAQNIESAVSEITQGEEVTPFTDQVNQARITEQINDYIRTNIRPGITDMEMQLHPASLGAVTIHLTEKEGVITAQFTTQTDAVRAAVESQLLQLKERFEEQGIKVSEIQVLVSQERFADRGGQGSRQGEEDLRAQKAGRRRRLRVAESGDEDGEEASGVVAEEDEADRIAVDMMQRSGNSVDFTA